MLVLVLGMGYWVLIVVLAFGLPHLYIQRYSGALHLQNLSHVPLSPRPDMAALCGDTVPPCSPQTLGSYSGRCGSWAVGAVSWELTLHFNIVHLGLSINILPRTGCIFHIQCIPGVLV